MIILRAAAVSAVPHSVIFFTPYGMIKHIFSNIKYAFYFIFRPA